MAATAERLTEIATRHQVFLERVKTGEANQFAAFLLEMDRELRARLGRAEMTDFARARAEALVLDIERTLAAIYGRFWNEMRGRLIDIAEYEAGFEARSLAQGTDGAYEPVLPGVEQVRAAVLAAPMSVRGADGGKLLESFVRDWSATEVKRVSGAIRQGFYEGATTSKILQAVRGTKAKRLPRRHPGDQQPQRRGGGAHGRAARGQRGAAGDVEAERRHRAGRDLGLDARQPHDAAMPQSRRSPVPGR